MDKELIAEVVIEKYVRSVVISESRRATYYRKGEKIPKKYEDKLGIDYYWRPVDGKKGIYLVDDEEDPIIKNPNVAGTQRKEIFNGQSLHALTLLAGQRAKIIQAIKKQMIPEIDKLEIITTFPIRIIMELYDTFYDMEYLKTNGEPRDIKFDIDNRSLFYCKTFPDVLQGCLAKDKDTGLLVATSKVIIPEDDRQHITQPPVPLFFPIENAEDRKLVFKIYHDKRDIIVNNKYYGNRTNNI